MRSIKNITRVVFHHIFSKDGMYWIVNYALRPLRILGFVPDKVYLKNTYRCLMGEKLDLKKPISFNAKMQWLKLYDRQVEYVQMVDKYLAKDYVKNLIGEKYIIPTIGVWNHFDEIEISKLPTKFVLKTTHGSGNHDVLICKDKSKFDFLKARRILEKSLKTNCYLSTSEWVYKNISPRILCEEIVEDPCHSDLRDYKFMCFNGKVKCSFVCSGRNTLSGLHVTFYDREWNIMPFERNHPVEKRGIDKPQNYEEMVYLAEKLSSGIPFLRVDFYDVSGKIYFGELTFYPGSGFEKFKPREWDDILGDWIELPQ